MSKDKLYVWKQQHKKPEKIIPVQKPIEPVKNDRPESITARNISDLARNLDILDKTRYN